MRKAGLLIVTFIYLAFTAGISLQRHYCMNRVAAIRFTSHPEDRCGTCGMEKADRDSSCCRDEQTIYKITDDQQPEFAGVLKHTLESYVLPEEDHFGISGLPGASLSSIPFDHGPPGTVPVPLFILHCVYRI